MPKQLQNMAINPPLAGIVRKFGFQSQPQFSCIDSLNFVPFNGIDGRRVFATRPPLVAFETPGVDVNLLCTIVGTGSQRPIQSVVAAADGLLYILTQDENGDYAWGEVDEGESSVPVISTDRPVYATPFVDKVIIANNGTPLVYDHAPQGVGVSDPRISELTASSGTVPTDCRIVATWQGCVWFAGAPDTPHILTCSKTGDHTAFNIAAPSTDEAAAFSTTGDNEGLIGEPITALMPQTADTMIVGCTNSMLALRGHPRRGGIFEVISDVAGPMGQGAWCKAPDDRLFVLTRLGMMTLDPQSGAVPAELSRQRLPDDLVGLLYEYTNPVVSMAYCARWRGVIICVRGDEEQAWFYDLEDGGFHKWELDDYPNVMLHYDPLDTNTTCGVLFGGPGYGGIAHLDVEGAEDFNYSALIGPLKLSESPHLKSMIHQSLIVFGTDSTLNGTVTYWTGTDGEEVYYNATLDRGPRKQVYNIVDVVRMGGRCYPKLAGHAALFELDGSNGRLIFEGAELFTAPAGRELLPRKFSKPPEVSAGPDQTAVL